MVNSWLSNFFSAIPVNVSFTNHDRLRKAAGLFAGLGHLQPILLATTNSHYLLDRFCMERCCSSEYISRIVTSIIFMEILSIIVVRLILYMAFKDRNSWTWSPDWQSDKATGETLNTHNEDEERYKGYIGSIILCLITLGYIQILLAFIYGGKKGHMHWFYASLLIQHFLNSLIAGSIGFWEVGLALWYLATLPMAPIVVFFYQLIIHSWIRNNGPRDVEYIVVEWQIGLATAISILATILWIIGYTKPYIPIELEIDLNTLTTSDSRINAGHITQTLTLKSPVTGQPAQLSGTGLPKVKATVTLTRYSITLVTIQPVGGEKYVTLTARTGITIQFNKDVTSATQGTKQPEINLNILNTPMTNVTKDIKYRQPGVTIKPKKTDNKSVTLSLTTHSEGTITSTQSIQYVTVTIPVDIKVAGTTTHTITSVILTLTVPDQTDATRATNKTLTVGTVNASPGQSGTTLEITVTARAGGTDAVQVPWNTFTPKAEGYCIYSVRDNDNDKDIWAAGGGKCLYVACYKGTSTSCAPALLCLYLSTSGGDLEKRYFGKDTTGAWKEITKKVFSDKLPELANGQLTLLGTDTTQYNREYDRVLGPRDNPSATWAPLVMQGLSVGAVGSIFPNLIPKTLTCPKTTRNLSVINMFLVTVPHIFNVLLAENNPGSSWFPGVPWDEYPGDIWAWSLLYYIIYALAILFAIFNIHYPEWALSSFLRNNTWMVFLMILFTDVLNETFNAISRAGICSQKTAGAGEKKNHPCLHNKIACLMNLTYIPFWMTTTPMMKSYVSSLDPFLCDKDRDHWPTARYGRMKSFGYWCKCACRGLYNSPRKLVTLNMRKALTRKDPKMYFLVTHDIPPED